MEDVGNGVPVYKETTNMSIDAEAVADDLSCLSKDLNETLPVMDNKLQGVSVQSKQEMMLEI
jgi:hypothetical protein